MICGALIFSSCGKPYEEVIELQQFMYLALSESAESPVVKSVETDKSSTYKLSVSYGGTTNYRQGDITVEIGVDNALVDAYNAQNSTNYLSLPAEAWSLDKTKVFIPDGDRVSDPASLTVQGTYIDQEHQYLVPVTIKSAQGGHIPVSEKQKTTYYVLQAKPYDWEESTWEVISLRSQWSSTDWAVKNIFDGNNKTKWHSDPFNGDLNGFPQWFVVDMQKIRPAIKGFLIWQRDDDIGNAAKNIVFFISDDNEHWTEILDIPEVTQDNSMELDYKTTNPVAGRYLRVEIRANWPPNSPWTHLAEITPY